MSQAPSRERLTDLKRKLLWVPQKGPQMAALLSEADMILYGGGGGGGKTDLAIGMALTEHKRTLFIRREYQQLLPVVDRISEIVGGRTHYHAQDKVWRFPDGRQITLGGVANPNDSSKYQGSARDLLVVDEAANVLENDVIFLMGWVRSTDPKQRTRILLCSNPPQTADGEYLMRWWSPWLDPSHPEPAVPGELRWFARIDGKDTEVPTGKPFTHDSEKIIPMSRTFIPARVADNRFLRDTNYVATLQALPEPLRSQILKGDFTAGAIDGEWQVIPTQWVKDAQKRWKPKTKGREGELTAMGVDVARGGSNDTVVARRYGWWYAPLDCYPSTPSGGDVANKVIKLRKTSDCPVNVDVVGVGSSVYDFLNALIGEKTIAVQSAEKATTLDRTGTLGFANRRAELWWRFKELLDPSSPYKVALPPDARLTADLCAPTYRLTARGIQIEGKPEIAKRLGRSTDYADAVIYASIRNPVISAQNVKVHTTYSTEYQSRLN